MHALPKDAVKIKVQDAFVTLTGEVPWRYQHSEAARTLRTHLGVTGVANHIKVKHQPDTAKIEDEISHALHCSMWAYDHVEVSANEVKVESWQDRHMAWATAWRASGTTSVVNDICVS